MKKYVYELYNEKADCLDGVKRLSVGYFTSLPEVRAYVEGSQPDFCPDDFSCFRYGFNPKPNGKVYAGIRVDIYPEEK